MRIHSFLVPAAAVLLPGLASAQSYYEARNAGMGGIGTSSSNYLAAGWANPALLTRYRDGDDFGLILPTVGATAYDKDGLIDDLNDFVDEYDRIDAQGAPTAGDLNGLADQLAALDNRQVTGTLGLGVMLAIPSRNFGFALHAKTYGDLQAFLDVDEDDLNALRNPASVGTLPAIQSEARVVGVAVTELGVSMATSFGDAGSHFSVGVTPKFQQVDTFNYGVTADNFDDGNFDDDVYRNDDSGINVDVGVAWELDGGFALGAIGRNLIGQTYETNAIEAAPGLGARTFTYDVNPTAKVGASWHHGLLTVGADVDAIVAKRFTAANGLGEDDVRLANFGAEFDVWRWLQLRAGYQLDLEDTLDPAITAGIGLSPFDVLHLDVAGSYIDDNNYGAVAQFGLTF